MTRTLEETLQFIDTASTAALASLLTHSRMKLVRCISHICFLTTCLKFNLRPHFISFQQRTPERSLRARIENSIYQKTLDAEKRYHYSERAKLKCICDYAPDKLGILMDPHQLDHLLISITNREDNLHKDLCSTKREKLETLSMEASKDAFRPSTAPDRPSSDQMFAPPLMNLSGTFFSDAETTLLRRVKKFAINPFMKRSNVHALLLTDLGAGLRSDTRLNSSRFSQLISDALNQACRHSSPEYSAFASLHTKKA